MSCIIWMLLKANNVWGNRLEYWQLRSTLSRGLIVCVFLFVNAFLWFSFFLFFLFVLLVWWLCICLYHRCFPGRHAAFSHTLSSTRTTLAVQMNWTNSSMEENSSSLFCWTLWVEHTNTRHGVCLARSETCSTGGVNWNLNEGQDNDSSVTHAVMMYSLFLHHCESFFYSSIYWSWKCILKEFFLIINVLLSKKFTFIITIHATNVILHNLLIIVSFSLSDLLFYTLVLLVA